MRQLLLLLLPFLAAVTQFACIRHPHEVSRVPLASPAALPDADEAEMHRRNTEWYNLRHPDGGLRQKAVEEKQKLVPATSGTVGPWRPIGPQPIQASPTVTYSGRVWGITVDPRNSNVVYIGTDGGGVWKTLDGGTNWVPLTDSQPNLNIRDLAMARSAPDTLFAATYGGGILKSADGGATWTTCLPGTYVISVAVHPSNPSIILATDHFLRRSADGGATWTVALPTQAGFTQVAFDPTNGNIAYAALNQAGLYRSTDSGVTWSPVAGQGLPSGGYSYTFALAPSSPNILYLTAKSSSQHLIGFYRSADSGATWTQIGAPAGDLTYWQWSLSVHPTNPNLIYAGCYGLSVSTDGGFTWAEDDTGIHVDHHVATYSADGNTLYIGNDGGIWKTNSPTVANSAWVNLNATLNTVMFYPGISISPANENVTFGGTQDNGTIRYQGTLAWDGSYALCGDGGYTAIDFELPQNVYVACGGGFGLVAKSTDGGNGYRFAVTGINMQDPMGWIPPLVMDPSNPRRLYFGTNRIYQTVDGAGSWSPMSPALGTLSAIAVAPSDPNTIYAAAGTNRVFVTRNALLGTGATWMATPQDLPVPAAITQLAVDPQNPMVVWATVASGSPMVTNLVSVYRTVVGGMTWGAQSTGLPNVPANDILIDPDIPNTIYVATDIGVYRTSDSGQSWLPLGTGLPNVICHSLQLHRSSRTLRVATYGRGMWDLIVPRPTSFLSIRKTHTGNFTQGQSNAVYTVSISNASTAGPTSGRVTVTEAPPPWLTLVSMTGNGWTCPASSNICSRSDSLPSGAAYPSLTVLVNVAADAPSVITNFVTVSGGGAPSVTAYDVTDINSACTFSLSPGGAASGVSGGNYSVAINAAAGCVWTVSSNASWLTILSGASGSGNGTVNYSVAANSGPVARLGILTIAGQWFFRVNQSSASGLSSSAAFVKMDTTTQGSWRGAYGRDGFALAGSVIYDPDYAQPPQSSTGGALTWSSWTTDPRALQYPFDANRLAAAWYVTYGFDIEVYLTDGNTHQVAVYCLDWDSTSRSESVQVVDAATQTVLDTRILTNFSGGTYLVWNLGGHVLLRFTRIAGASAVASGLFFDPPSINAPTANLAIFRNLNGQGLWALDGDGNYGFDAADKSHFFGGPGDQPVAGDWTGNGQVRIGVFRPSEGKWYLDLNNNGQWDGVVGGDGIVSFGAPGDVAVVGDWNGDGRTKPGVFRCPQTGFCTWVLDYAGKFAYDSATAKVYFYGGPGDLPVVNNWNGTSNIDQIGVYRPMSNGLGLWIVDSNGSGTWEPSDAQYWFGVATDLPVVGNWNNGTRRRIGVFRNGKWVLDADGNNAFSAADAVAYFGAVGDKPVVGNWTIQ